MYTALFLSLLALGSARPLGNGEGKLLVPRRAPPGDTLGTIFVSGPSTTRATTSAAVYTTTSASVAHKKAATTTVPSSSAASNPKISSDDDVATTSSTTTLPTAVTTSTVPQPRKKTTTTTTEASTETYTSETTYAPETTTVPKGSSTKSVYTTSYTDTDTETSYTTEATFNNTQRAAKTTTTSVVTEAAPQYTYVPLATPTSGLGIAYNYTSGANDTWGLSDLPKLNGIHFGWLPADGSSGTSESIQEVLSSVGQTVSAQGYYAQATGNYTFTGSQFTDRADSIVAAGGIFQPAVMPLSWWGLTNDNNQQAVAICNVMKKFTDAGVPTWLRFAHEANWYQTDGTYQGTVSDFLEGWVVVAKACKQIAPDVKMFWTPNVANAASYAEYWPGEDYVDIVGIDYYPTAYDDNALIDTMQDFHNTYTSDKIIMALGETALSVNTGITSQLKWANQVTSEAVATAMPNLKAVSWFNFDKEENFKIANIAGDSATHKWLSSATA